MDTEPPTALRGYDSYEVRLGDELRGHRATLGKSLLDVQRELRIKASYIDAIENCDASVVPNRGFVPGYVRAYARYLGLDADEIYARFCEESGFVGQTTRASAPGAAPTGGFRLGGGLAAAGGGAAARRSAPDPALSRSHFAAPVGRARPVGLGVSLSDLASVLVLAGLIGGLGYGGWALVKDIQRVDFAPSNETPVVAEEPDNVALPGFDAQAAPGGWPGLDIAPRREREGWDPKKEAALAELYAPREIAPPVVELRDGPIAAIDPASSGLYAGPRAPEVDPQGPTAMAAAEPAQGPVKDPAAGPVLPQGGAALGLALPETLTGAAPETQEEGALIASAGDPTLPRPAPGAPTPAAAAEGVWLVVTDPAWVQVKARDGSILVQRIMESGESWQVPLDEPGAELRAGNAGGVWLQVDGALHGPIGRPGEVVKRISLAPARVAQQWPAAGGTQVSAQN